MAKDSERLAAQVMYIDQMLTAKEIAVKLKLSEKTVGKWVDKGKWKDLRSAKQTGPHAIAAKYNELLDILLTKRLELEKKKNKTEEEEDKYRGTIDEMSKVSAMIEKLQKDGRASLRTHIHCIEKFMGFLSHKNQKLFSQTIEIQQEYLPLLAEELDA
jgi:transposase